MTAPLDPDVEKQLACLVFITPEVVDDARAALRTAIRTACVAAERRGIERAGQVCLKRSRKWLDSQSSTADTRASEADLCFQHIHVLPVPESTA